MVTSENKKTPLMSQEQLRYVLEKSKLSLTILAQAMGIKPDSLNKKIKGINKMKHEEYIIMIKMTGYSFEELFINKWSVTTLLKKVLVPCEAL